MAAQTVTYNNSITLNANTFTRTGYTFSGWVSDTNASHPDKETFTYQRAANTIMYAQWTPITYSIKYNANGGSGTMSNTSATYDVNVTLSNNAFTRTGYSFSG
ncbi:MAG: InlB B-repeat-containing protein [Methanobrevibacter sp.]|nr:InlB B-repeat-containing protein [Methanobrevibacter sp.]